MNDHKTTYQLRVLNLNGKLGGALTAETHQELHTARLEQLNPVDTLSVIGCDHLPFCICKIEGGAATIVSANHVEMTA